MNDMYAIKPIRLKCLLPLAVLLCLALGESPAHAQSAVPDADGSADIEFLTRYRDSGIVRYDHDDNADFLFALARVRKLNNRWQAEQERRVYGAHTSITYRAPDRVTAADVFEHFRSQIADAGFDDVFYCAGRSCGDSNKWANVIYSEKRLYGPDANQHYLISERANQLLAVYVIKRGNKRVYARIDLVVAQPESSSVKSWSDQLQASGRVGLPADIAVIKERSAKLSQVVDWLSRSGKTVHVVGHAYGAGSVDAMKKKSLDMAVLLRGRLIELGADASLVEAHGLGPLAPGGKPGEDRLELLIIE